jgi:hypothetical protein
MKKIAVLAAVVALLGSASEARSVTLPCGLPATQPLWVEFADTAVGFRMTIFGRPGLVLASSGIPGPAELRALGAQTVYWHMKLQRLVGTPTAPADPATIQLAADNLFLKAVTSSGCATPVIALNELNGVHRPTPWVYETAIYRQNVLNLLKALAAKGAVPFLLVPGTPRGYRAPYVQGDARAWWLEASKHAYLVRQMHFNARFIYAMGPVVGARTRRTAMRHAVQGFLAAGIPAERMGLLLGFQSGPGKGGREGLEPRAAWFEIVKQDALAARQVTTELGLSSIWSWGWGTFNAEGADSDKPAAACVYLWTRDASLCDGLTAAGPRFNSSLTIGQIILPAGAQCSTGAGIIREDAVEELVAVTGNQQAALTALLNRLIYADERVTVSPAEVDAVVNVLVSRHFAGDASAYEAALTQAGLTPALARTFVADQLRHQAFEAIGQVRYLTPSGDGVTQQRQREALRNAICLRDELPGPGVIDWGEQVPFLDVRAGSLSLQATRYRAPRGTSVQLFGQVESERPAELVTVYGRKASANSFTNIGTARPDADGSWSLGVRPTAGATYYKAVSKSAASFAIVIRTQKRA